MKDVIEISISQKDKEIIAKIIAAQPDVDTPEQALLWLLRSLEENRVQVLRWLLQNISSDINLDSGSSPVIAEPNARAATASSVTASGSLYEVSRIEPDRHTEMDRPKEPKETNKD